MLAQNNWIVTINNGTFLVREHFAEDTFHFLVSFLSFLGLQEADNPEI